MELLSTEASAPDSESAASSESRSWHRAWRQPEEEQEEQNLSSEEALKKRRKRKCCPRMGARIVESVLLPALAAEGLATEHSEEGEQPSAEEVLAALPEACQGSAEEAEV